MTQKQKERNKMLLMTECMGVYMYGTIFEMNKIIEQLCEKYFPNCDKFTKRLFCLYFNDLRSLMMGIDNIDSAIKNYKKYK